MLSNVYDAFSSYNESTMKTNLVQGSTRISIHMDKKKNMCVQKKVTGQCPPTPRCCTRYFTPSADTVTITLTLTLTSVWL